MKIREGDSVLVDDKVGNVAIVERNDGPTIRVRFPFEGPRWDSVDRNRVHCLAGRIAEASRTGEAFGRLRFDGRSTLADLVSSFGYAADSRLRQDSLAKVERQLERAGLRLIYSQVSRDSVFRVQLVHGSQVQAASPTDSQARPALTASLPDPFWPIALGLDRSDLLRFLRALVEDQPVLCILRMPDSGASPSWLLPLWEGLTAWAYQGAQRFRFSESSDLPLVVTGPAALLSQYRKASVLNSESALRLLDGPRSLNLLSGEDVPEGSEFEALTATWPGPVFSFSPNAKIASLATVEYRSIVTVLALVGGAGAPPETDLIQGTPLGWFTWARQAADQLLAGASARIGPLLQRAESDHFRGSNEGSDALALKVLVTLAHPGYKPRFEVTADPDINDLDGELGPSQRVDVKLEGLGAFEVETLRGSGPIENFYHRKVFSRLPSKASRKGETFHLVVPGPSILWFGPFLADLASHVGDRGRVCIPVDCSRGGDSGPSYSLLHLGGCPLPEPAGVWSGVRALDDERTREPAQADPLLLDDIAGYSEIKQLIRDEVLLVRQFQGHPDLARTESRSGGILLFGPPGCGKTRIAQAICGELGHDFRSIAPSDVRGIFVGWGQVMLRDQFEWLFADPGRVLVFDEFDSVARSRREANMHSDEKANVNELLILLDRAAKLGRLVVCTTNFVESLDEAVTRPGRIGDFVPIGPPDVTAATEIVDYWLGKLGLDPLGQPIPSVVVERPPRSEVAALVRARMEAPTPVPSWFSGADLRDVVFRSYRAALRRLRDSSALQSNQAGSSQVRIPVTTSLLEEAFVHARRSVTAQSIALFLKEVRERTSPEVLTQVQAKLGDQGDLPLD